MSHVQDNQTRSLMALMRPSMTAIFRSAAHPRGPNQQLHSPERVVIVLLLGVERALFFRFCFWQSSYVEDGRGRSPVLR